MSMEKEYTGTVHLGQIDSQDADEIIEEVQFRSFQRTMLAQIKAFCDQWSDAADVFCEENQRPEALQAGS